MEILVFLAGLVDRHYDISTEVEPFRFKEPERILENSLIEVAKIVKDMSVAIGVSNEVRLN